MGFASVVRLAWVGVGLVVLAGAIWGLRRRKQDALLSRLRAEWGKPIYRDCDIAALTDYHRAVVDAGPVVDDRTWEDLNLSSVFTVLDHTESTVGQQALYHRLRTPRVSPLLDAFEAIVRAMGAQPTERERIQIALSRLRDPAGYQLWRLADPKVLECPGWYAVLPLLTMLTAAAMIATPIYPIAILGVVAGGVVNLLIRAAISTRLRQVIAPFRQVGPLLAAAETIGSMRFPGGEALVSTIGADAARLSRLKRLAGWVSRDLDGAFDLGGVVFEYLNLLLLFDANAFYFGARELKARGPALLRLIAAVGDVDAAASIASYRKSTTGWTRPTWRSTGPGATMAGIRHPLLADAVPNTVMIGDPSGVIVTGSNMSGKSTFLRTVGVTTVMAQSVNTCLASSYEAPAFVVRSCIGRADDPAAGKSYYLVEVDSVLALVRDSQTSTPHLFLFDELFRGTNAVERIAAGEAVLRELLAPRATGKPAPHVVIAATHDQELVELVMGWYVAYHFTDAVGDEGLAFDYQLQPGVAASRNAIKLLKVRGGPEDMVSRAMNRAAALDRLREPELLAMGARAR